MSRHHTFPRCTREAPYMGRYRPTHALIATTDRILTVFRGKRGACRSMAMHEHDIEAISALRYSRAPSTLAIPPNAR